MSLRKTYPPAFERLLDAAKVRYAEFCERLGTPHEKPAMVMSEDAEAALIAYHERVVQERDRWKNEAMLMAAHQGIDNYQRCLDALAERDAEIVRQFERIERERDEAREKAELSATRLVSECDRSEQKDKRIAELEAENARLREDAERYEYLRNPHNETYFLYQKDGFGGVELMSGPSLDDAIDEARKP